MDEILMLVAMNWDLLINNHFIIQTFNENSYKLDEEHF